MDFTIEDNCYVNDKFIGTTVAKKITVNILNPNNQIDLEDKEIEAYTGIIIDGKEESVPFGNFIIEKPESEEVKEKTNFVGYDYMIKFNILYENRVTYPIKASVLFEDVCLQAGVKAGSIDFVNCDYMILGNPFTNNENCRTVLSNIAQLAGGFAHIGRDNKVYIVALKNTSKLLRVKDINFMFVKDYNITPVNLLSTTKSNADEKIDGNSYFEDFSKNTQWGEVNSLILRVSGTEGENNTIEDKNSIVKNGLTEIVIEDNYFLNSEAERIKVINPLWNKLKGIKYLPFKTKYYGYPYLDVGDMIYIEDSKDNGHVSYVMNHTFTFNGTYEGTLETPALTKTQTAYKNTVDVKTKFKQTERVIDKINGVIKDIIEENSETSNKLTLHEQTIDSMKDTLKSQETKIKTAQSTANTANSTANSAKTKADSNATKIQTTTTKLAEVEETVDEITQTVNETKQSLEENYSTTEETEAKIKEKAGEVTVETNKKIESIQIGGTNLLQDSAFPSTTQKWNVRTGVSIDTTNKMNANNSIKMDCSGSNRLDCPKEYFADYKAGENLTLSVWLMSPDTSKITANVNVWIGYRNASGTAIANNQLLVTPDMFANAGSGKWFKVKVTGNSTNANSTKCTFMCATNSTTGIVYVSSPKLERGTKDTDWSFADGDVVKDIELGQKIEVNWEHVKVAWNTICEYLQLENLKGNASLVVRDGDGKLIMSLDKTGQHYWTQKNNQDKNIAETTLKDITINNQTKKALMFLLDNTEMNGEGIMAWGYKSGNNVYPVLYVGNFGNEEFGLHLATDLIAHANAIKFQNAQIDDDGANLYLRTLGALKVMDIENNTWIGQIFKDEGNYGFSIKADDFSILDSSGQTPILATYTNENGEKTLNLFDNSFFAKNIHATSDLFADGDVHGNNIAPTNNCDYIELVVAGNSASLLLGARGVESTARFEAVWVSDARLKKDVKDTNIRALELINKIEHREFNWKEDNKHEKLGYIAQELEEIDSNFVKKYEVKDENENVVDYDYTINDKFIISLLTKGMQEQQEMIDKQQAKIDFLMKKIDKKGEFKFESKIKKTEKVKEYGEKIVIKRKNKYEEKKKEIIVKNEEKKKEILNKLNKKEVKAKA